MRAAAPTAAEILLWPSTVDVPTGGSAFGIGRGLSYELARRGEFPVAVRHIGSRLRVVTADIIADLGIKHIDNGEASAGGAG